MLMRHAALNAPQKTYVENVFSSFTYTGNGSTQTITNGINLSINGGLVWLKNRTTAGEQNKLIDTVGGIGNYLSSDSTSAQNSTSYISAVSPTGFSLGNTNQNTNGQNYASWTFRKARKFFDIVTWSGDGNSSRALSHALNLTPGFIVIKRIDNTSNWPMFHRGDGSTLQVGGTLNSSSTLFTDSNIATYCNASTFKPTAIDSSFNTVGQSYVAYLFAHDTATDGMIQCGTYTGNGSSNGPTVTLGWEPQFLMVKRASASGDWVIIDSMRGMANGSNDGSSLNIAQLFPNLTSAESDSSSGFAPFATGFQVRSTATNYNANGSTYVYMAIRRGPMKRPTNGSQVYNAVGITGNASSRSITGAGFPPDMVMIADKAKSLGANNLIFDRMRGRARKLFVSGPDAEASSGSNDVQSFNTDGVTVASNGNVNGSSEDYIYWFFRRYPGFFDIVPFIGGGSTQTEAHNLGVVPELMIFKDRDTSVNWAVYHVALGATGYLYLNADNANGGPYAANFNNTAPTASVFTVSTALTTNNDNFTAYLFATLSGVSKVFNYTGNGSSQTINCGFAAGARFILIKRSSSTGDWFIWDTVRGVVSGNDPHISLNSTSAEVTSDDSIDPDSTGFIVNQVAATNINVNGATYVGFAIA